MFGDNPSPETPPNSRKGFFALDKTAVSSMSDDEIAVVGKVAGIGGGMDIEEAYQLIDLYNQE